MLFPSQWTITREYRIFDEIVSVPKPLNLMSQDSSNSWESVINYVITCPSPSITSLYDIAEHPPLPHSLIPGAIYSIDPRAESSILYLNAITNLIKHTIQDLLKNQMYTNTNMQIIVQPAYWNKEFKFLSIHRMWQIIVMQLYAP